jgi:hypothetical protein
VILLRTLVCRLRFKKFGGKRAPNLLCATLLRLNVCVPSRQTRPQEDTPAPVRGAKRRAKDDVGGASGGDDDGGGDALANMLRKTMAAHKKLQQEQAAAQARTHLASARWCTADDDATCVRARKRNPAHTQQVQEALKDAAAAADGALTKLAEKLKSVNAAEAAKQEQALAALADEVTATRGCTLHARPARQRRQRRAPQRQPAFHAPRARTAAPPTRRPARRAAARASTRPSRLLTGSLTSPSQVNAAHADLNCLISAFKALSEKKLAALKRIQDKIKKAAHGDAARAGDTAKEECKKVCAMMRG